jgi:hypothetical protein
MGECRSGRRAQGGKFGLLELENEWHDREANRVNRQLTLYQIMANKAVIRVVIAGLWGIAWSVRLRSHTESMR